MELSFSGNNIRNLLEANKNPIVRNVFLLLKLEVPKTSKHYRLLSLFLVTFLNLSDNLLLKTLHT